MDSPPSAFLDTARHLRNRLREARLDHDSFDALLRPCELASCRATCCHDGAVLSEEEAQIITSLLESRPDTFTGSAVPEVPEVPEAVVVRHGSPATATRPAETHECATDFPAHFPRTRCVFLDRNHKCTLQLLSSSLGHHPWFYKPISCWMHPILLRSATDRNDRPTLTLLDPAQDRKRFASCTHCGRPDPAGVPARQVLHDELAALSQIANRDLVSELNAPRLGPGNC